MNPAPGTDDYPADTYGNAVAQMAMRALATATYLTDRPSVSALQPSWEGM